MTRTTGATAIEFHVVREGGLVRYADGDLYRIRVPAGRVVAFVRYGRRVAIARVVLRPLRLTPVRPGERGYERLVMPPRPPRSPFLLVRRPPRALVMQLGLQEKPLRARSVLRAPAKAAANSRASVAGRGRRPQ